MKNYFIRKRIDDCLFSESTTLKTNSKGLFLYFHSYMLEWSEILFLK